MQPSSANWQKPVFSPAFPYLICGTFFGTLFCHIFPFYQILSLPVIIAIFDCLLVVMICDIYMAAKLFWQQPIENAPNPGFSAIVQFHKRPPILCAVRFWARTKLRQPRNQAIVPEFAMHGPRRQFMNFSFTDVCNLTNALYNLIGTDDFFADWSQKGDCRHDVFLSLLATKIGQPKFSGHARMC